ncbi:MAG: polysaccharide biosynthesis/export family protein [Muribaculaceae bacterium]|nr:polysaccharide biosynthesis/export family protein [Muribaculaceae bacterium]
MNIIRNLVIITSILMLTGCAARKNQLAYFKDLPKDMTEVIVESDEDEYSLKIVPDDELLITVTSLEPTATSMFNLPMANVATRGDQQVTGNVAMQTYIVDSSGDIRFPMLGIIHVEGMTTKQLTDYLIERISPEVESPMIRVEIVNFAINVLGDVKQPGRYTLNKESITVLDALAMAGDMSEYGHRNNVLLIRREGNKKIYHRFDLRDSKSLESPYFYLKQNDVIYIEPDEVKASNAKYNTNNSFKLSVTSTIVSAVSVIASLIIALTR